jgi:hypothetical protein
VLPKSVRLKLVFQRLNAAGATANHDAPFALIAEILNAVEVEHSGIPANPSNWRSDGRMYPPQADNARSSPELPGVVIYRSRGHHTLIAANGAFTIIDVQTDEVLMEKLGLDGKGLPLASSGLQENPP